MNGPPVSPPDLEAVVEADRQWFLDHSRRMYRLRAMEPAEREAGHRAGQSFAPLLPGARWFTVVRRIADGARHRVFFQSFATASTDQPDETCRVVYEGVCSAVTKAVCDRMAEAKEGR